MKTISRIGLAALMMTLAACSSQSDEELARRWATEIERAIREGTPAEMVQVAPFEWDRMEVLVPYIDEDRIEKQLGFRWNPSKSRINGQDAWVLVAFVRGDKVVRWFDFPIMSGDMIRATRKVSYSRDEAFFEVKRDDRGYLILVPTKVTN